MQTTFTLAHLVKTCCAKQLRKKGANSSVKIDGGNIEEYFCNEKLLAAAGGAKALLKQRQYSISLKGDEIVKITPAYCTNDGIKNVLCAVLIF